MKNYGSVISILEISGTQCQIFRKLGPKCPKAGTLKVGLNVRRASRRWLLAEKKAGDVQTDSQGCNLEMLE